MRVSRPIALAVFLLVVFGIATSALGVTLRVRGGARIDVLASEMGPDTMIRGKVTDDVGASLGAKVTLKIEGVDRSGSKVSLSSPRPCAADGGTPRLEDGAFKVATNESGDFCVLAPTGNAAEFVAKFAGNEFFDDANARSTVVAQADQRIRTVMRFESPPGSVDLSRKDVSLVVSLRIDRSDAERLQLLSIKREGLKVTLKNETGATIGDALTGGDGRVRFSVPARDLGTPGNGTLEAVFAGEGPLAATTASTPLLRTAEVEIEAKGIDGTNPDAGITLDIALSSAFGKVDSGVVEALVDGETVGTSAVVDGAARLVATFPTGRRNEASVTIRYLPSSPWWVSGAPISIDVPVGGSSLVRHLVFGALVLLLAAWIVLKWRRSPEVAKVDPTAAPPSGRPEILVVDRPSGLRGWRGTVTDAHEGYPVAGATLKIVMPGFANAEVLMSTTSDSTGSFELEGEAGREARLVVEGDLHAAYEQPLPPPSILRVALVTRRRALLDRLVRWARSRGGAFDGAKEPTPGHVRRVAARNEAGDVEQWARSVENAAFGPDPVTQHLEADVAQLEPKPNG